MRNPTVELWSILGRRQHLTYYVSLSGKLSVGPTLLINKQTNKLNNDADENHTFLAEVMKVILYYYAALFPRRGPHIASHSVCLSVRMSVCPSVPLSLPSVTSFRQPLASRMYFSARTEGRISWPSRLHKFLLCIVTCEIVVIPMNSGVLY